MEWTQLLASFNSALYVSGSNIFAAFHWTFETQFMSLKERSFGGFPDLDKEVTWRPDSIADWQILLPVEEER